jgi:hypothetical protein
MYNGCGMAVEIIEACADAAFPVLDHFAHHADWLDMHAFQWVKATEHLNEYRSGNHED